MLSLDASLTPLELIAILHKDGAELFLILLLFLWEMKDFIRMDKLCAVILGSTINMLALVQRFESRNMWL